MNTVDKRDPQTYAIIGASMEIHRQLGHGFLEAVYQEAAAIEFPIENIAFEREVALPIKYKNILLPIHYRADFVCFDAIVVELKVVKELAPEHKAQVLNYLKATGFHLGLLVNFGHHPRVELARIVL